MNIILLPTGLPLLTASGSVALSEGDTAAPVLQSTNPADNATDVSISANTVLNYDGTVVAGTGSFTLRNLDTATDVESIAVGSVGISGSQVTINWTADLAHDTEYQVTAPAGILQDAAGNGVAAIAAGALTFTTAADAGEFDTDQVLGPTSSIVHRGVTFNFASPVSYIESPIGEPIVITNSTYLPSGSALNSTDPASGGSPVLNGMMLDPLINSSASATVDVSGGQPYGQGFDESVTGPDSDNEAMLYVASMNVDPGAHSNGAYSIPTDFQGTLLKAVRDTSVPAGTEGGGGTLKQVPLTFMASLPPSAGTWFRPAKALQGVDMVWRHKAEDVDAAIAAGVLRDLARPTDLELASFYWNNRIVADEMQCILFEYEGQGDRTRRLQLSKEEPVGNAYSRDLGRERGQIGCALHIDPGGDATEIAARRNIALTVAQWGIDMEGARRRGMTFRAGAGQNFGKIQWAFLAGFLLGDAEMLDWARLVRGNSLMQLSWITAEHVGYPTPWDPGTDGANAKIAGETYQTTDVGIPEWMQGGWIPESPGPVFSNNSVANLHALYRDVAFSTLFIEIMPICLLRNGPDGETGDAAIRDGGPHDTTNTRAAAIAYMDRLITIDPWKKVGVTGNNTLAKSMYALWRDEFEATSPLWTGRPDVPANPVDEPDSGNKQINVTSAASGEMNFRFDWMPFDYSTLPITDREIAVSHDNVQFAELSTIATIGGTDPGASETGTATGLRPGLTNVRWRQENSAGWSKWTATWGLVIPESTNAAYAAYKPNRNEITVPGTASGTLTRRIDPAIHYRRYPSNEMPYYEPAAGADLYDIDTLYCGLGYWTGGTGAISDTYQWQRSADGSTGWTNCGGTDDEKSYVRTSSDLDHYIRCAVTVNGTAFNTASVYWPPAVTFPATTLLQTRFDAMFPFEWPDANPAATGGQLVHDPYILYEGTDLEYRGGIWCDKDGGDATVQVQALNVTSGVTYRYKVVTSYGQATSNGNSSSPPPNDDYTLKICSGSGGTGTLWLNQNIDFSTYGTASQQIIYEGTFTPASSTTLYVHHKSDSSGILGAPGLLYVEIKEDGT